MSFNGTTNSDVGMEIYDEIKSLIICHIKTHDISQVGCRILDHMLGHILNSTILIRKKN